MKKIAITQRIYENDAYYEIREALDTRWIEMFVKLGFYPVILSSNVDFKMYDFDGVILSGGNTLNSIERCDLARKRDTFEKAIIKYCIEKCIPVFGVCRGMQIIAEYFGSNFKKVDNHVACIHNIKPYKNLESVNSYHNYAIRDLGLELTPLAQSDDGVIEAIEHKHHKVYAQMWHPERSEPFASEELAIIKEFFD